MNKKLLLLLTLPLVIGCSNPTPSSQAPSSTIESSIISSSEPIPSSEPLSSSEEISSSEEVLSSEEKLSSSEASSAEPSSSEDTKEKYLFYTIKEGETKDGLEGSPWLNVMAPGVVKKIEKPSLKDDFYVASNYDYLSTATLKEDQIADGGTLEAIAKIQENFLALGTKESMNGNFAKVLKKVYSLYVKADKTQEIDAVKALVNEVKAIENKAALYTFLSSKKAYSFAWSLFELMRTETGATAYCEVPGWTIESTSLPFTNQDEAGMNNIADKYSTVLTYFGLEEQEAKTAIKEGLTLDASYRNYSGPSVSNEGYKVSELSSVFNNLKYDALFKSYGYQDNDVIVFTQSTYALLKSIDEYLEGDDFEKFKKDLIVRICMGAKYLLPEEHYIELAREFDPNGNMYNAEMFLRERLIDVFQSLVDRAYIDNFETKERKETILAIMKDVVAEYHNIIDGANWLSKETKQKAKAKIDAITYDCCYPDHLLQLPDLSIGEEDNTLFNYVAKYRDWRFSSAQPAAANPQVWFGTILTINAVYNSMTNSFVVYEGMLASNQYQASDTEGLYASIGTVIGHEISHAFDNNGSRYDQYGMESDWWKPEEREKFEKMTKKIVDAYDKIYYKENVKTWGDKMLGEIIADMGGVSVILKLAEKKADFDYKEFFNAYSQSYASVMNPMFIEQVYYMANDVHPMNYLRVNNVLNQYPKFHEVFDIKEGDLMYTASEDRIVIW